MDLKYEQNFFWNYSYQGITPYVESIPWSGVTFIGRISATYFNLTVGLLNMNLANKKKENVPRIWECS